MEVGVISIIICSSTTDEQQFYKSMENLCVDSSLFVQASERCLISWCRPPSPSRPGRGSWERVLEADLG